jgi:hypothetical protein
VGACYFAEVQRQSPSQPQVRPQSQELPQVQAVATAVSQPHVVG